MITALNVLSDEECDKMYQFLKTSGPSDYAKFRSARDSLIFLLMLDAGMRVAEVSKLTWKCLWSYGHPLNAVMIPNTVAKAGRERHVPMSTRLNAHVCHLSVFAEGKNEELIDNWVFTTYLYAPHLSVRQIQRIISGASLCSISRSIHPHILRHTFATRLMRTTSTRIVQQLLGHKSLSSTQVYTHPNSLDLQKAIDSL